ARGHADFRAWSARVRCETPHRNAGRVYGARVLSRALLCVIALALATAGCGGGGGGAKSADGVRATLRAYIEDLRSGRGGDACDLLTDAARAQVGRGNAAACGGTMAVARS